MGCEDAARRGVARRGQTTVIPTLARHRGHISQNPYFGGIGSDGAWFDEARAEERCTGMDVC